MNLFRKSAACLLAASVLLSVAACSGSNSGSSSTPTTTTIDDDIENPVDISAVVDSLAINFDTVELANKKLVYFGNYDMRKAGDIKPAVKFFEERYGGEIEYVNVAWDAMEDTLANKIASDDSPDLIDKQDNTYPHWIANNLYEALDDYINLDAPQWEQLKGYVDRYGWQGKHYYYPWVITGAPEMLIYNRGLFEQDGIDDPKELYDNNEWTWAKFKEVLVQFVESGENRTGLYGYIGTNFINNTGTQLIDLDSTGKLVNNMKSASVTKAANYLEDLRKENLAGFPEGYNDVSLEPIADGTAAFQSMGGWIITDYCKKYPDQDIFFVPFPRDETADKYYMRASNFGYLVPKGSKNIEGACVFINSCRLTKTDTELAAITKESIMKNKKYSDEQYEFLVSFDELENFNYIMDETFGFPKTVVDTIKTMLSDIAFNHTETATSWTVMVEQNFGLVQDAIDKYNAY